MTEVVLYHHVQGLTEGVQSFAEALRQAGHTVHTRAARRTADPVAAPLPRRRRSP